MKKIYKYQLTKVGENKIRMPKGTKVLTAQNQTDNIEIWAITDDTQEEEIRTFVVIGTGTPFEDNVRLLYISTVQVNNGALVWHIFERTGV